MQQRASDWGIDSPPSERNLNLRLAIVVLAGLAGCQDVHVQFSGPSDLHPADVAVPTNTPSVMEQAPNHKQVIRGTIPEQGLGGGLLTIHSSGGPRGVASLIVGAATDPTAGRTAGSVERLTLQAGSNVDYEGAALGGAGDHFGCAGVTLAGGTWLAVSACERSTEGGSGQGAVYLLTPDALASGGDIWNIAEGRIEGTWQDGHLGSALAAGDLDGDGTEDLVISAPQAEGGRGRVVWVEDIYENPWQTTNDTPNLARGTAGDDSIGSSLHISGDITGDGVDDLLACAPGWDIAGAPSAGACAVVAGGWTLHLSPSFEHSIVAMVYGARVGEDMGLGDTSIRVGEFLATDAPTLAIGLPGANDGSGAVILIDTTDLAGAVASNAAAMRIDGTGALGTSIASLPDHGLLVGAPEHRGRGAAFAVYPALWPQEPDGISIHDISSATWIGMQDGDALGTRVYASGDINGDHWPDVVIGAPGANEGAGKVLVDPLPTGWGSTDAASPAQHVVPQDTFLEDLTNPRPRNRPASSSFGTRTP